MTRAWGRAALVAPLVIAALVGCEMAESPVRRAPSGTARADRAPRDLWMGYCASCHGVAGQGTPVAMVRFDAAWQGQRSDSVVRARITHGVPGTPMAGWGRTLSAAELDALVTYVRGMGR